MSEKKAYHINILRYHSLPSTSSHMKTLIEAGELTQEYSVVVCSHQSAGRGQGKNKWDSRSGENLTFSLLLHPHIDASAHFYLNMCISLGIKNALDRYTEDIKIKWPNDIYVNDHKLCGILIESTIKGHDIIRSVVGIGINILQKEWEDWVPNPTSLSLCSDKPLSIESIMHDVIDNIHHYISILNKGRYSTILSLYHKSMYLKDTPARFCDAYREYTGVIQGVDEGGRLIIKDCDTGEEKFYMFKEVKYVL